MKKFLLTILVLSAFAAAMAQTKPVVKPQQYKILIERSVYRDPNYLCYKYERNYEGGSMAQGCVTVGSSQETWCYVQDPSCNYCGTSNNSLQIYVRKGASIDYTSFPNKNLAGMGAGPAAAQKYFDTLNIFQPQFDITSVLSNILQSRVYPPYESQRPEFKVECDIFPYKDSFPIGGEFYDRTSYSGSGQYNLTTRVRVIPNLDPTFTLPSHDRIQIQATGLLSDAISAIWEYRDTVTQTWHPVPAGHTSGPKGSILEISAYDLFGNNYVNFLHSTVNFQVRSNNSSTYSSAVPFTVRLSSPHITSVTPTDLKCFERNDGSMKINFDRALLPGERLNILLYDTLHRVNYSALNIDALDAANSYTWKGELRAGMYFVNLLGKYAKGIPYDLTVSNRIDTVRTYIAANSINFEEDFSTPIIDDFNAYTDYTGYSQATYTGDIKHLAFAEVKQPDSIRFVVKVDANVLCKGSTSGSVTIGAAGGKGNYKYSYKSEGSDYLDWVSFDAVNNNNPGTISWPGVPFYATNAVSQVIGGLKAGTYTIRVRDGEDCYMKDALGNEKTFTFKITEPERGLTVDLFELSPITAAGATNGKIKLQVSGGTPFLTSGTEIPHPLPYDFEWRDSATNQLISTYTATYVNNTFETSIENLSNGTYIFRLYDSKYNASDPNNSGCYLELIIPVKEPEPLVVTIEKRRSVSCTGDSNGELAAIPSGGIPVDSVRYLFKWYRQTAEGDVLLTNTDSLLEDAGAGTYVVEITDKYNNTKQSEPFVLTQPSPMQLAFTTTQASCYSSFDGTMTATVTGGTPFADVAKQYAYEWSTGDSTAFADSVAGGNYLLVVRDSMNCIAKDTVSVTSPVRLIATHTVEQVTCHDTNDGEIAVSVTGGNTPYTYTWSKAGITTATASGLAPGTYWYKVSDANGCFDSVVVDLDLPDTLLLDLGPDRVMCTGQTIHLNASVAATQTLNYTWSKDAVPFAVTSKVAIKLPGTYDVAVNNSRGCILKDTIMITTIDSVINTDFVVSTQAYVNETVHLINISKPATDSVKWIVPSLGNTIRVLQQNNTKCELMFADTGRYEITMRAYYRSGCIEDSIKTVNVISRSGTVLGSQSNAFLKVYAVIFPNPNNGTFKVQLEFSEVTSARLRLVNTLNNLTVDDRPVQGSQGYLLDYNLGGALVSGTYILVIDTAKGSFVYKVVIVQ